MSKGRLEIIEVVPGPGVVTKLVQRFGRERYGIVTLFGDQGLTALKAGLEESTLVDIKPFGELVRQIHRLTGLPSRRLAGSRQIESALRVICEDLKPSSIFRRVAEFHGFHEALRSSIRELEHWGLQPTSLSSLASTIAGATGTKLQEIADIWLELNRILESVNSTTSSTLIHECLGEDLEFDGQDSRILVFMSNTLHPLALQWLQWLADQGSEITIVCEHHATDGTIFQATHIASEYLGLTATSVGEGNDLLKNLFARNSFSGAKLDQVEVHVAGDPLAECEWALRHWMQIEGEHEGAILVRDLEKYGTLLASAAERLRVPIQIRRRVPLLSNGFAKTMLLLLKAMAGTDVRELEKPLSSSYIRLPSSQKNWFMDAHAERGAEYQTLRSLVEAATSEDESDATEFLKFVLVQRALAKSETRSFSAWHSFLRTFLEESPWFESLVGSKTEARDQRAFTAMLSSLGQDAPLMDTSVQETISFERWVSYASMVWESSDVSLPSSEFGIPVITSPDQLSHVSQLYVLGMIEGSFPRRRSEDPILSDEEKQLISNHLLDTPRLEDSFSTAKQERDVFYKVCACTSNHLYLSYPMPEGESDSVTAFYLQEVKRICGVEQEILHGRRTLVPDTEQCASQSDLKLRQALDDDVNESPNNELTHPEAISAVKFDFNDVQPRQLRTLKECNFRFSAERNLPAPSTERDYFGNILRIPDRAGILVAQTPELARKSLLEETDKLIDDLRPKLHHWELDLIERGAHNLIDSWIQREFESRSLWSRNPVFTQLKGGFGTPPLLKERFKYQFQGPVAGVTTENGVRTVHLYRRTVPKETKEEKRLQYLIDYAAYFSAAWHEVREVRIEVEGIGDNRTLLLFCPDGYLPPRKDETLLTINLALNDGSAAELAEFVRNTLAASKQIALAGKMPPTSGEHCAFCSYSELCRVSQFGGEEPDPFAFKGAVFE